MPGQEPEFPGDTEGTPVYEATTESVRVLVQAFWLEDQSEPSDRVYCWAYRIRIENHGSSTIQLLGRHWEIIDAAGRTEHVRGEGVVGEQPVLTPAAGFEYTSGASLDTPGGIMRGTYTMTEQPGGRLFEVRIPAFSLDSPFQSSTLH
ncbi:Co2+/Mg2+ efflux protein ApaG [Acetobacter sp. AN02]|uniref:Co2+/Mg2+ efflux protein ApaG n=1 Tax=Acetobacter sp. AN02 TaxID=2894186 RepID=UPI00243415F8|nr:Co2+/Mg2+ efflux protein ApaG [Acetobacter sp. AN02]MDG6095470.1 Co2+/Mg2+ efflux protein ApaG [Acetobacter sp. AN02]